METGAHKGISETAYDQIDAVRSSHLIKLSQGTPMHLRYAMEHPTETAATELGTALHIALLEPDSYDDRVVALPWQTLPRSKSGKQELELFQARHAGKIHLRPDAYASIESMRDAVYAHPLASRLLRGPGESELTLVWDEEQEMQGKARLDHFTAWDGHSTVIDVKTTRDLIKDFGRTAARYGYTLQQAWYQRGLAAVTGERAWRFAYLVVEKDPPHGVALVELDPDSVGWADGEVDRLMALYTQCHRNGIWPGYLQGDAMQIEVPKWTRT